MIVLLGMPGAGKTTQTELLAKYLDCPHFSMGGLIRQYATGKDREQMLAGKIIGDEITLEILAKALEPIDTAHDECIVEGNPRTIPQADWWLDKIRGGDFKLTGIIHLTIDPTTTKDRLMKRGRVDDTLEVTKRRLDEYNRNVVPTIKYLKQKGLAVKTVDGSGTIEEVAERIHKALGLN